MTLTDLNSRGALRYLKVLEIWKLSNKHQFVVFSTKPKTQDRHCFRKLQSLLQKTQKLSKMVKGVCNDEMNIFVYHYVLLKIICPLFSYEQTWRVNQHFSKAFKSSMEWCVIINYGCLFEIFIYIQKYISVVVILRSKSSIFTHRCRFRKLRYLKVP